MDGEIVVLDKEGRSDFTRIQPRFGVMNPPLSLQQKNPATYYPFDLLYCDGYDLRNSPLEKRKELLHELLRKSDKIRYSDHVFEKGMSFSKWRKNDAWKELLRSSATANTSGSDLLHG